MFDLEITLQPLRVRDMIIKNQVIGLNSMLEDIDATPVLDTTGPATLPVEYLPLNRETVSPGQVFGPVHFSISHPSHEHHSIFIDRSVPSLAAGLGSKLLPGETWCLPRVLSQYYGRQNETLLVRGSRTLKKNPSPGQELVGNAVVEEVLATDDLCVATFYSRTSTRDGVVCLEARDVILLINGCNFVQLKHRISSWSSSAQRMSSPARLPELTWSLRMRYEWPERLWRHNVHTASFSHLLGYQAPLVEAPAIADLVLLEDLRTSKRDLPFSFSWRCLGPLCEGSTVSLYSKNRDRGERAYTMCLRSPDCVAELPIVLAMEIS